MPSRLLLAASARRLVPILALTTTLAVGAQEADPVPATLEVSPEALEMRVGESAQIRVVVRDAAGAPIDGPTILFLPDYGQFWNLEQRTWGFNLFKVAGDGTVTASKPGDYAVRIRVPAGDEDFLDARVPLRIVRPPIARLELVDPPRRFYADTIVRLETRMIDGAGELRDDLAPAFHSDVPEVARVDRHGNLELRAPGTANVVVTADDAELRLPVVVEANGAAELILESDAERARTGDVIRFDAIVVDGAGEPLADAPMTFSFNARTGTYAAGGPSSGLVLPDGRFVADLPGEYTVIATSGKLTARRIVTIVPRDARREIDLVGHGRVRDYGTSDLWIWEGADGRDYALTGTHGGEGRALIWDVTDPASMEIVDSVQVDARNVNDVKVNGDATVAVISREGASNRRNGIVLLDVSSPGEGVEILAAYDDELTGGVHNLFVFDDHVYALSGGQRYDVISIEDPGNPHRVGRFQLPNPDRSIHDVWVADGIAYSANWNDGVVMVDVGGGGQGGSPREPVMMGQFPFPTGWNHAVYPYRSESTGKHYIFAGDEAARSGRFSPRPERGTGTPGYDGEPARWRGWIHVLEWEPGSGGEPILVARFEVPEAGSHNIWVEDDVMYVAFYNGGLRVVDVSGELLGDLYRQGREIARFLPFDPEGYLPNAPQVWGAQPFKGNIFFSDYNSGLWAVRLRDPEAPATDGS